MIENRYLNDFIERNIKIFFTKSDKFSINLYGYDKRLKYTSSDISEFPNKFFSLINKMPMRILDQNYLKPEVDISYRCSLPNNKKQNIVLMMQLITLVVCLAKMPENMQMRQVIQLVKLQLKLLRNF